MSSAEDILSNPGSSWFYLNHRYFYGIGNTRSVDLTEGCEVPSDALFLLLGCGDIRNALQTVHEVTDIKPLPKSLTFHLNDIDDVVLARNTVLLCVLDTINPSDASDVAFLWNVWYNINLSEKDYKRLKSAISYVLEETFQNVYFQSTDLSDAVKRILRYWLATDITLENIQSQRESFICKKAQKDMNKKERISFSAAASYYFRISGFQFNQNDSQKDGKRQEEVHRYFRTGSTDEDVSGFTNPTLLCPHIDGWRLHPLSFPFSVFNGLMFDKTSSLTENCIQQLQSQLKSWKRFKEKGSDIKIAMWGGDALSLCHRRMPSNMKFDFINTSNLCDHLTLLNVLLAGSKRLKSLGVLTVQTMHFIDRDYDTVDDYLEKEVGIPFELYPTFLGLKLADDFDLGTSKLPMLFSGCSEVTIRWLSAGKCSPCLDLGDSANITQIFERVINRCFESCMLLPSTRADNSPLTAIYLIMELSSKLTGGVTPLLEIARRCLPKKYTVSGEQFSPLELEWNVLTMYHFSKELKKDDPLLCISAPFKVDWSTLPAAKLSPAGFDFLHRAVVIKNGIYIISLKEGVSFVPWSILSLVDYDYQTCTMRCILPRSEVERYGPDTEIWPIQPDGGLSPLRATESYTLSGGVITSLPMEANTLPASSDTDGDSTINLNIKETEQSYRITLTTKNPKWTVKSFEVNIDTNALRTINLSCTTLASDCQDMHSSTRRFTVPCHVEPPQPNLNKFTNTVEIKKALAYLKGPLILPFRRMNISAKPIFPETGKKDLFLIVGTMFFTIDDIKRGNVRSYCSDVLFDLKESIQMFLNWSIDPPQHKPLVPYRHGIEPLELEMFYSEFGGLTQTTCHGFYVSLEEANLLKKLLQVNTKRSVQTVKYGSPTWCFNSFLQPVFTIDAERVFVEFLRGNASVQKDFQRLADMSRDHQQAQPGVQNDLRLEACEFCGEERPDLKKCSRCKTVSYCGASCQKDDWKANHKKICQELQPQDDEIKVSSMTDPKSEISQHQKCGVCGITAAEMKRCSRCRNEFYCSKQCQQTDWKRHKTICVAHDK